MIESSGRTDRLPEEVTTLTARIKTLIALSIALTLALGAIPVYGAPSVSDKRAEARRVKAQIDDLDRQVEVASEAYNEAASKHNELVAQVAEVRTKLKKTKKRVGQLETHLNTRAESMYRHGPLSFLEVLLSAKSFEEFATTWDLLRDMNTSDADAIAELKIVKAEAEQIERDLASHEAEAKQVRSEMASNKAAIESKLGDRERMLSGLESEIGALEEAERQRAEAAARAATRAAAAAATASSSSGGGERQFPPPTRAARSEVVSVAKRYLGAPYRWGASGPNSFDCSGFTMFVYSQVGVSLPHSSRAQIGYGERVSRADLQAGDLVFFGSPIHHVGIYVGSGQYIHAPHTGAVVRIDSLSRGDYAGAARP